MKKTIFCLLAIVLSALATAQNVKLSGVVSTPDSSSREWGICYISSGSERVASRKFTVGEVFSWQLRAPGAYTLSFVMPGYEEKVLPVEIGSDTPEHDLGVIAMLADDHLLDAAVVSTEGGRLYFDKENITLDVAGDSLLRHKSLKDVIARLPLVSINRENNQIEVASGQFAVTVNGKKNLALSGSNINAVADYLKGENVKSVSINTAPVGRHGQYSAVIDIRVERDLADFIVGGLSISVGDVYSTNGSADITLKAGKSVVQTSYFPSYRDARERYKSSVRTSLADPLVEYAAYDTVKTSRGWNHALGLNASYDLSDKDVLFLSSGFSSSSSAGVTSSSFMDSFTSTDSDLHTSGYNATLSYQHDFKSGREKLLTLQAGMSDSRSGNSWDINGTLSDNDTREAEYNVGIDFSHSVSDRLSYYANGGWRYRDYTSKSGDEVLLDYPQSILFCEGSAAYSLGKFRLTAQGKYEHTDDIRSYHSVIYMLGANWFLRPGQMLRLTVSQNIYRAGFRELNNYEDNSVAGTTVSGNSSLGETRANNILLMYSYMIGSRFSVRPMFSYRTDNGGGLPRVSVNDDGSISTTYASYDGWKSYRFSSGMNWNDPDGRYNINFNPILAKNVYASPERTISNIEWSLNLYASAHLWKGVYLGANVLYANPDFQIAFDPQATKLHNILHGYVSLSRRFGSFNAYVRFDRPWSAYEKEVREQEASGYRILTTTTAPINRIVLGLSYSFGRSRAYVKTSSRVISASDRML